MFKKIGVIGVGHLAEYLLTGLQKTDSDFEYFLADPAPERAQKLARLCQATVFKRNQDAVNQAEVVILCVRPNQFETALEEIIFSKNQVLVAVTVGIPLSVLRQKVHPAQVIRVLPISCVAINMSPVLIYPEHQEVQDLFSLVGRVHLLEDETQFEPATALVGAYYAWLFALMNRLTKWTVDQGLAPDLSRDLVAETMQGASSMAIAQSKLSLQQIWESLATPDGISEYGINIINGQGRLDLWIQALDSVTQKLKK